MNDLVNKNDNLMSALTKEVEDKIVEVRGQKTLLDFHVAVLYGVETREVNQAVRNNPRKFPEGYVLELTKEESAALRSKLLTLEASRSNNLTLEDSAATLEPVKGKGRYSKYNFKVFTERGLYMLATILKSKRAEDATIAIIETFAKVRELKKELLALHTETDKEKQKTKMQHFGEVLSDIVMPDLQTSETESSLEINFFIGKIKHTVKRVRKNGKN